MSPFQTFHDWFDEDPSIFSHWLEPAGVVEPKPEQRNPYLAPHCNIPPCEKKREVFYLELQEGCPHNTCAYCKTYKDIGFSNKKVEEVKANFDLTLNVLENRFNAPEEKSDLESITRFYLGGADILTYPTWDLVEVINYAKKKIEQRIGRKLSKISGYTTTSSLAGLSEFDLGYITRAGFNLAYWGLESGSSLVLDLVNKGYNPLFSEYVKNVISKLKQFPLRLSVFVMPGLGGIKYSPAHIIDTIEALATINPSWITFLSINPKNTEYDEIIKKDNDNRHMTPKEVKEQMIMIADGLEEKLLKSGENVDCLVAAYNKRITPVCRNPFTFRRRIKNSVKSNEGSK